MILKETKELLSWLKNGNLARENKFGTSS